jgi:hypothetical protein
MNPASDASGMLSFKITVAVAGAASRGLRVPCAGSWIEPNSRSGARNLIEYRYRALPGKETSMYIGIGTIVLIVIIVLVILMLRRRLCFAAALTRLICLMNKQP